MENVVITAQKRTKTRTKGAVETRREGFIPAVIYGGTDPVSVGVTLHDMRHVIYSPDFHRIQLDVDGEKVNCIVKDVQFDPITDNITHIDFLRLIEGTKVKVEVPLHFTGVSAGLKAGGKLIQKVRKVKIKAAPENLVDAITLDVTNLQLGQSLRVRDIKIGDGVEILNSPGIPIASVQIPRVLKAEEPTPAAAPVEGAAAPVPAEGDEKPGEQGAAPKKGAEPAKK